MKDELEGVESPIDNSQFLIDNFSMVGERSVGETRMTGRTSVADRSENAGMSSEKHVRTMFPVNLRFPTEGQSASG